MCAICHEPLAGNKTLRLDEGHIHAKCFRCSVCRDVIASGHFNAGQGRYHCSVCHAQAWQAREDAKEAHINIAEKRVKARNSKQYRLCWRPELVPCSKQALCSLGVHGSMLPESQIICFCHDATTGQVSCVSAPKWAPEAAVNVSYLAVALRVLLHWQREPQFSLDPKDPHDISGDFQVKRFYPQWLATTVYGEVLFQSDYELKKLCVGDTVLPELSCIFDMESTAPFPEGHAARQWFVVRRAGVTVASDGVVLPYCEMGVNARRLVPSAKGYVDAEHTDPNDALVCMAKSISDNFLDVAAKLPAVAELVKVARATILARYLLECRCRVDENVLDGFNIPQCPEGDAYTMEIPTLRTHRRSSSVSRRGRSLVMERQHHAVHGGVDLGLQSAKVPVRAMKQSLLEPWEHKAPCPLFVHSLAVRAY